MAITFFTDVVRTYHKYEKCCPDHELSENQHRGTQKTTRTQEKRCYAYTMSATLERYVGLMSKNMTQGAI